MDYCNWNGASSANNISISSLRMSTGRTAQRHSSVPLLMTMVGVDFVDWLDKNLVPIRVMGLKRRGEKFALPIEEMDHLIEGAEVSRQMGSSRRSRHSQSPVVEEREADPYSRALDESSVLDGHSRIGRIGSVRSNRQSMRMMRRDERLAAEVEIGIGLGLGTVSDRVRSNRPLVVVEQRRRNLMVKHIVAIGLVAVAVARQTINQLLARECALSHSTMLKRKKKMMRKMLQLEPSSPILKPSGAYVASTMMAVVRAVEWRPSAQLVMSVAVFETRRVKMRMTILTAGVMSFLDCRGVISGRSLEHAQLQPMMLAAQPVDASLYR